MAAGGMGDVLTGVIAGIAAQCGDLALAARAGVFVHAQAGDLAARGGERGLLASDVLDQLRACVNPREAESRPAPTQMRAIGARSRARARGRDRAARRS